MFHFKKSQAATIIILCLFITTISHSKPDYDCVFQPRSLLFAAGGGLLLSSPAVAIIHSGFLLCFAINVLRERIQANKKNPVLCQSPTYNNTRSSTYTSSSQTATIRHVQGFANCNPDMIEDKEKAATRIVFDKQFESLHQLSEEWSQLQDMYNDHDLCDDGRYERRKQALDSIHNGECIYETKLYTVSPAATQLIRDMGTDITEYQTCYGNQLQQVIHQECIDGIERLTALPETSVVYPYKESMALCFDAAREYNQADAIDKATAVTDFCWSLFDYGKAIAEGFVTGVVGAIEDLLSHPGQAVLCAVAAEYVLAYQLSKVLYNVADIGLTYLINRERGLKQWDEYVAPVTQLIDAISNKELSLRDGLKGATQLAVQWKAQGKLLKGMNKFCKTAKAKVLEFAKNNPLATPEQYMVTPEGILLQSTQNVQPPASGSSGSRLIKYTSSSKRFVANEQEVVELASKNNSVIQLPSATLQTIGKSSLNAPEEFFKHIFTAELVEKNSSPEK